MLSNPTARSFERREQVGVQRPANGEVLGSSETEVQGKRGISSGIPGQEPGRQPETHKLRMQGELKEMALEKQAVP